MSEHLRCIQTSEKKNIAETDLSRNQAIQNQRNSFLRGFPLPFQRGNAASIRGTFPDSAILSEIFAL
jgi:hypothetical protein